MRKAIILMGIWVLLLSGVIQTGGNQAVWAEEGTFLFSSVSNNTWVLDKSSRQLILVNFEKTDDVWKSQPLTIPEGFNLDECKLMAVGARGTAVFLADTSSGLVTFYDAQKNGTIMKFQVVNIKEALK
jgi:hypothetical protein